MNVAGGYPDHEPGKGGPASALKPVPFTKEHISTATGVTRLDTAQGTPPPATTPHLPTAERSAVTHQKDTAERLLEVLRGAASLRACSPAEQPATDPAEGDAIAEAVLRLVRGIALPDWPARYTQPDPPDEVHTSLEYEHYVEAPRRRGVDPVWEAALNEALDERVATTTAEVA